MRKTSAGCIVTIPVPISGSDFLVSGFPIHCPTAVNGQQRSTTANGQRRPVSKPERLLCRATGTGAVPCRAVLCCVYLPRHETRDTRHETRDMKCEMRNASSRNTRIKESRNPRTKNKDPRTLSSKIQEPKNPRTQEPKNPRIQNSRTQESRIKVDHYEVRRALPGDSDDASVCRFSCVRRKV